MFTGLIEEIGIIRAIKHFGGGRRFTIEAKKVMNDLNIDDSVSLNGVCQTVVALNERQFEVEAVEETLRKTTLLNFRTGMKINLERASKLGDRMGGHLVQGHVDCRGTVISIQKQSAGILIWISFSNEFRKYIVPAGSICIDGVSLTTARVEPAKFMISIIPHTWELTTLKDLKQGSEVNLEFDIIGKYVEKMVEPYKSGNTSGKSYLEQFIDQPE
jgi:riboflavin synthase